jgi:argininosuccinate lyase
MSEVKRRVWGGHLGQTPDEAMLRLCAGRDVTPLPMADEVLLPFDLWTNRAHAIMLGRQGIVEPAVLRRMLAGLAELEAEWEAGRFRLDPALEDVHVNVERFVSARQGDDAGGRLHTARSRNDQVTCDMRLYLRQQVLEFAEALADLIGALLEQAEAHAETVMPGFTHHQPAMITTWGHWLCGYAQALLRDLERAAHAFGQMNRSPLGAAAAFGTSWPIDREFAAELLGFDGVDANTLDCISSRWEHEAQAAGVYLLAMNHMSVMAQDVILLTHPYWNFARLPDAYVTGSSIMPQKRNPDFAEVIKGKCAWLVGMQAGLMALPKGDMSGYNRDSQTTKYAIMDIVRECQPVPPVLRGALAGLAINREAMRAALEQGFLAATDFADALARALGLPFRACYEIAAAAVRLSHPAGRITAQAAVEALRLAGHDPAATAAILTDLDDPGRVLAWRQHTGSPAPAAVRAQAAGLRADLRRLGAFVPARKRQLEAAWQRCRDSVPT